jgi:hypothetical protein
MTTAGGLEVLAAPLDRIATCIEGGQRAGYYATTDGTLRL